MLRIAEIKHSQSVRGEYIVLQNTGLVAINLRGWAVCSEALMDGTIRDIAASLYVFQTDAVVKPYTKVVLFTGSGEDGWRETTDGRQAYCAYWNRETPVWHGARAVNVLHVAGTRSVVENAVPVCDSLSTASA